MNGVDLDGRTHDEVVTIFKKLKDEAATFVVDPKAEDRSVSVS